MNGNEVTNPSVGGKRNSAIFSFFKWFKNPASSSKESVNSSASSLTSSGSVDSVGSITSTGTIASFSFIPPEKYHKEHAKQSRKIAQGPETETYKARLKQREKVKASDQNITLRKKYNLFFNRDTLLKPQIGEIDEKGDNSKSLPLMTKKTAGEDLDRLHRRTASESSKIRKAGAYCHVKGKRKAPQPPNKDGTLTLRQKKRTAPAPPKSSLEKEISNYQDIDVICNDSLKLDHGILKPAKTEPLHIDTSSPSSARSSYVEQPVSPRPWYKRNAAATGKKEKHDSPEKLPEVQYARNSASVDLNIDNSKIEVEKRKEDKRKSGISFLTNISELDREAAELVKNQNQKETVVGEMPAFMRPKQEQMNPNDTLVSPKRKSAKDLIAKFNAITNVTKVTVNAFQRDKKEYFGGKSPKSNQQKQKNEPKTATSNQLNPLMKSESASVVKPKQEVKETPKIDRKSWYCPKCRLENDYWRIICQVCSTIKPYFDDLTAPPIKTVSDKVEAQKPQEMFERNLERSKTQIGFSALARYNDQKDKKTDKKPIQQDEKNKDSPENKKEEREKLIKMLIEMKNSLPKRKINASKENRRTSIIEEGLEALENEAKAKEVESVKEEIQIEINEIKKDKIDTKKHPELSLIKEQIKRDIFKPKTQTITIETNLKTAEKPIQKELLLVTQKTTYENIKVSKIDQQKSTKVSSSAQTSAVVVKKAPSITGAIKKDGSFELIKPKDFADIYQEKMQGKEEQHLYANLGKVNAVQDSMSVFVNIPKKFSDLKNNLDAANAHNMDTLEINRLLRRLETAIAKGDMVEAAVFARELAQLKVNCSVVRQKENKGNEAKKGTQFMVNMFVEDRLSHRGPFPIQVTPTQTVGELKKQVEKDFEIPSNVQRWILGKELAIDDKSTLKDHHVTTSGSPVFLYLVAPNRDPKQADTKAKEADNATTQQNQPSTSKAPQNAEQKIEIRKTENKNATEEPLSRPSTSQPTKIPVAKAVTPQIVTMTDKYAISDEDSLDYDSKTLKPAQNPIDWECRMCTLLNPLSSNVCAVCSTVRQKDPPKAVKRRAPQPKRKAETNALHLELLDLDNGDLVVSTEPFECVVCLMEIGCGEGVTLRECLHQFCKQCLAYTVEFTEEAEIKCPYRDEQYSCDIALQDREIKALVEPGIYEQYLARSVAQVENKIEKSFHCKTPDCKGWCIFEDNVNEFRCPVCLKLNCLTCQAIHTGMNCKQYQEKMNAESDVDEDAKRTREMLEEMVNKGEALTCPVCQVILMKKWGCDWVRCSMCKTEICWVTRGPRWGPAGKGDTSGGCKCGVNGIKCHAQCNYCH